MVFFSPPPRSLRFFLRAAEYRDCTTAEFITHAIRSEEHLLFLSLSNSRLSFHFGSEIHPSLTRSSGKLLQQQQPRFLAEKVPREASVYVTCARALGSPGVWMKRCPGEPHLARGELLERNGSFWRSWLKFGEGGIPRGMLALAVPAVRPWVCPQGAFQSGTPKPPGGCTQRDLQLQILGG